MDNDCASCSGHKLLTTPAVKLTVTKFTVDKQIIIRRSFLKGISQKCMWPKVS